MWRRTYRTARTITALAAIGVAVSSVYGCGADPEGTGGGGGAPAKPWSGSECYACVVAECAWATDICEGEASCASYLECLRACPTADSGDADPTCEASCPKPGDVDGAYAAKRFDDCRWRADSAACAMCELDECSRHPVLCEVCPQVDDPDPCHEYSLERCCEARAACTADPECLALSDCWDACAHDIACEYQCDLAHPDGMTPIAPAFTCFQLGCAEPPCDEHVLPECAKCMTAYCEYPLAACWSDPSCLILDDCLQTCGGAQACIEQCLAAHPDEGGYNALAACFQQNCPMCV